MLPSKFTFLSVYFEGSISFSKGLVFFYLKISDFGRACLPGDMARASSLSLISFPRASARCKIPIRDVF